MKLIIGKTGSTGVIYGIRMLEVLKKLNIDPALASSVFVTTITDVIGFLSFLGLGAYYFFN